MRSLNLNLSLQACFKTNRLETPCETTYIGCLGQRTEGPDVSGLNSTLWSLSPSLGSRLAIVFGLFGGPLSFLPHWGLCPTIDTSISWLSSFISHHQSVTAAEENAVLPDKSLIPFTMFTGSNLCSSFTIDLGKL